VTTPPYTVIGTEDSVAGSGSAEMYVEAPVIVVKPAVAEMVKYVAMARCQSDLVNEIGRIAKAFRVDGGEVMNIIVQDTKPNVSPAYMHGVAYGGSCLPKDLSALLYYTRKMDVPIPSSMVPVTNSLQVDLAAQVLRLGARRISVFGLAFKQAQTT